MVEEEVVVVAASVMSAIYPIVTVTVMVMRVL